MDPGFKELIDEKSEIRSTASAFLKRAYLIIKPTTGKALKNAGIEARTEPQNLNVDIRSLFAKSDRRGENLGKSIKGLWERSESLTERVLDYQTAAWEKFQTSDADAIASDIGGWHNPAGAGKN